MRARSRLVAAVVVTALVAAACGTAPESEAERPSAPDATPVTVLRTPFLGDGPLSIAIERGWFADAGIPIEEVEGTSGQLFGSVVAGDIDVAYAGFVPALFRAAAQDAPVRVVATATVFDPTACDYLAVVGTPDAARRIASGDADRMRGLRIAGAFQSLTSVRFLEAVLAGWGLEPDDEVLEVVTAANAELVALMRAGEIDLAVAYEPNLTILEQQTGAVLVTGAGEVIPGDVSSMILFSERLLADRELGARFLAVYLRGEAAYRQGATDENVATLSSSTGIEPELLRAMCWASSDSETRSAAVKVRAIQQTALERGDIDVLATDAQLWDHDFRESALALPTSSEG